MADVTIKYKGANIATMDASGTKTLNTSGKYCEGDIQVAYTDPEKPTQSKSATPSLSTQTISPDSGKVLSSVSVAAITKELLASLDADFVAENIKKDVDLFGLLGTLEGGGGGLGQYTIGGTYTPVADEEFANSGIWQAMGVPSDVSDPYKSKHVAISLPWSTYSKITNTVTSYYRPSTGNSCCFLVYRSSSGQTGYAKYTNELAESNVSGKYFRAGATYYWVAE